MERTRGASLAKTLAVGSQDLAALAGFFCTDSVESNALATQYGHGVISTSALSILGALGLVKSSIKLALGLDQCRQSGLSLDSLRGVYGYAENEGAKTGSLIPCDEFEVKKDSEVVTIKKTRRYFDGTSRPTLLTGSYLGDILCTNVDEFRRGLEGKTLINLGNPVYENSLLRRPITAGASALFWSGFTAWPIVIARPEWNWSLAFATVGLHVSLALMVALPLWFLFQIDRPARDIASQKFNMLVTGKADNDLEHMIFSQYEVNSGHGIFFHCSTDAIYKFSVKVFALAISILCAVSYVCQYAVLKQASSERAAIWIGCQSALALGRITYWLFKRRNTHQVESCIFNDRSFETLNLLNLARVLPQGSSEFPKHIWQYLQRMPLSQMISKACEEDMEASNLASQKLFFLDLDFPELVKHGNGFFRTIRASSGMMWRLGLYVDECSSQTCIVPRVFMECSFLRTHNGDETSSKLYKWMVLPRIQRKQLTDFAGSENDEQGNVCEERLAVVDEWLDAVQPDYVVGYTTRLQTTPLRAFDSLSSAKEKIICFRQALRKAESIEDPGCYHGQTEVWHCAPEGMVLRNNEGLVFDDRYGVPQMASMRRLVKEIGQYIDMGHDCEKMSLKTGHIVSLALLKRSCMKYVDALKNLTSHRHRTSKLDESSSSMA